MTNLELLRWVFDGPQWAQAAAKAFGTTPRQVYNLARHGRLTARHYFVMEQILRNRPAVVQVSRARDRARLDARWDKRLKRSNEALAKYVAPVCERHRAA